MRYGHCRPIKRFLKSDTIVSLSGKRASAKEASCFLTNPRLSRCGAPDGYAQWSNHGYCLQTIFSKGVGEGAEEGPSNAEIFERALITFFEISKFPIYRVSPLTPP